MFTFSALPSIPSFNCAITWEAKFVSTWPFQLPSVSLHESVYMYSLLCLSLVAQ